jgi:hypothetical protein
VGERFTATGVDRIGVGLFPEERSLLRDVVEITDSAHTDRGDPGYERLNVPVYLGDEEASEEWWRLMGQQLDSQRSDDRAAFDEIVSDAGPDVVSRMAAEGFLRVVNASRLVLAARLGIEVEEDFSHLSPTDEALLWFLSFVVDDLSGEFMAKMPPAATAGDE